MKKTIIFCSSVLLFCVCSHGFSYLDNSLRLREISTLNYQNYAEKGTYENEIWFGTFFPASHYYDLFGNPLVDGYDVYSIGMKRADNLSGNSTVKLSDYYTKWFNGLIVIGDFADDRGVLALAGSRIKSFFTPYTLNLSLYSGVRLDVFAQGNYMTLLMSRISDTGIGSNPIVELNSDWLEGAHLEHYFDTERNNKMGATYINIHNEDSANLTDPLSGVDADTTTVNTLTALSVYGINYNLNLSGVQVAGENTFCQDFHDGASRVSPGIASFLTLNREFDENLAIGGKIYRVEPKFHTDFKSPIHPQGDSKGFLTVTGRYMYQLVEDNDDKDDYPENGVSNLQSPSSSEFRPIRGDIDGVYPLEYDKNKDGIPDYRQDFLSFDTDPPATKMYLDANNNLIPDNVEDDDYPDYTFVPSYYVSGENYSRINELTGQIENNTSDGTQHKGLTGIQVYFTRKFPAITENSDIEATAGIIHDATLESSAHNIYTQGVQTGTDFSTEKADSGYGIVKYTRRMGRKGEVSVSDMLKVVSDNVPNHTVASKIDQLTGALTYYFVQDKLPLRNGILNRSFVEYNLAQNRGLNIASRFSYEFGSHSGELQYLYPARNTSYVAFVNKIHYIYAVPLDFLTGLFIIPQYKNIYEYADFRGDLSMRSPLDDFYYKQTFSNYFILMNEYKITQKTRFSGGLQYKTFSDFFTKTENYAENASSLQFIISDHYRGFAMYFTMGIAKYDYKYADTAVQHNPLNNPHGVTNNLTINQYFININAGF